ncbi:MAG TPA: hypothetical protein DCY27_06560 [Desulfobacterales bacterium]|nr:hypothetical protein [Desulfobacterales bacterium]
MNCMGFRIGWLKEFDRFLCRGLLACLLLAALFSLASSTLAQTDQEVTPALEQTLLAENWPQVWELLNDVTPQTPSPVLRLIKGHAGLALNKNNESLCLFLSASSPQDRETWRLFSDMLAQKYSNKAITQYLQGDALARNNQRELAMAAFDKALSLSPENKHVLTLNARGVTQAMNENWLQAINDLETAVAIWKNFAEGYTNRGTVNIRKKAGAEGALRWFGLALQNSPDYCLAFVGQGCAQVALGKLEDSKKVFQIAKDKAGCGGGIVDGNIGRITAYLGGWEEKKLIRMAKGEFGTELSKRFKEFTQNPNQITANNFHSALKVAEKTDINMYNKAITELKTYSNITPGAKDKLAPYINNGLKTNVPGGWGEFAAATIPQDFKFELSNKAGVNLGPIGVETGKGIGAGVGGLGTQVHQLKTTNQNFNTWKDMSTALGGAKVDIGGGQRIDIQGNTYGGVTANLSAAHLDEGDWPFEVPFALSYE